MTRRCTKCKSTFVTLALEIPTKRFFICGSCGHRWNEETTAHDRAASAASQGFARPNVAPLSHRSSRRPGL